MTGNATRRPERIGLPPRLGLTSDECSFCIFPTAVRRGHAAWPSSGFAALLSGLRRRMVAGRVGPEHFTEQDITVLDDLGGVGNALPCGRRRPGAGDEMPQSASRQTQRPPGAFQGQPGHKTAMQRLTPPAGSISPPRGPLTNPLPGHICYLAIWPRGCHEGTEA